MLATGREAPQYLEALSFQMAIADTIARRWATRASISGCRRGRDALERALGRGRSRCRRAAATFALTSDKRTHAAFAIEHLRACAGAAGAIALPAGAPFGTIAVNRDACTMCLACVGACPEGALLDHAEPPQLRFIESNCVQCGLCEHDLSRAGDPLVPRLDLTPEAKRRAC